MLRFRIIVCACVGWISCSAWCWGQANVVLRDLTLITDQTVHTFNQDSVRMSDGTTLSWDQILRGRVAAEDQQEFDRYVREIGLPLYQMKQRIRVRDWTRLDEVAGTLFVQYSGEDSTIGKTVCLASAKGKLETGARAEAVIPFLMASIKQSSLSDETLEAMGYQRSELAIGVSPQLLPVWFDLNAVGVQKQSLVAFAAELGDKFPGGGYVYLASFSLALGELEEAKGFATKISDRHETLKQWKRLMLFEIERQTHEDLHLGDRFQIDDESPAGVRAVSRYFDAIASENALREGDPVPVILQHMKVAALWGKQFPDVSAAALYRAARLAESVGMSDEAETISRELLRKYSKSYHGKIVASEDSR